MTTDTTTLSGYLLDYYAALAENMPNPRLRKHEREDTYICCIGDEQNTFPTAYSPTTNPERALPIIDSIVKNFEVSTNTECGEVELAIEENNGWMIPNPKRIVRYGKDITEAALRALVAWKFPDGLPEPIYESEK